MPRRRACAPGGPRAAERSDLESQHPSLSIGVAVPSSWSSRRELSPETSRLMIERAHDEFVGGNLSDPRLGQVRGIVQDSWRRSLAHLVGPDGTPPLDLSAEELEAYRSAHPLAGAMDMIRALLLPSRTPASSWPSAMRRPAAVGRRRPPGARPHGRHGLRRGGELVGGGRRHLRPGYRLGARALGADPRGRALQPPRRPVVVHGGAGPRPRDPAPARRHRRDGRQRSGDAAGAAAGGCHGARRRGRTARRRLRARAAATAPSRCGADRRDALRRPRGARRDAAGAGPRPRTAGGDGAGGETLAELSDGTPRSCCCSPFIARDCRPTG
jgi:hypothetical protein